MRGRFLAAVAFALCAVLMNGAQAENIAPGLKVIVLDAGHGGKFPGAHYGKVYEKDLTLAVVLRLGRLIEQGMPGVKVVYTRKTDKELGATLLDDLQARADIANGAGGELFVSVHVNAAAATSARGVETLIMGETPKEQRYNENALYESNREDLIDMSDERTAAIVRAYIQNLQFTYGEYSMAMARCIQSRYGKAGRHLRGIKPQLLRVLYATDMPGVLTEIGFMSNPQEMAYMKSEKGQAEIARSLYNAVRDYDAYLRGTQLPELDEADAEEEPAPETVQAAGERLRGCAACRYGGALRGAGACEPPAGCPLLVAVRQVPQQGEAVRCGGELPLQILCGGVPHPGGGPQGAPRGAPQLPRCLRGALQRGPDCQIKHLNHESEKRSQNRNIRRHDDSRRMGGHPLPERHRHLQPQRGVLCRLRPD